MSNQKSFASANTTGGLSYKVGDRVSHIKFGAGEVMAIVEGGRDYEVTVDFDKAGTKKMFASFAKLKKLTKIIVIFIGKLDIICYNGFNK